MNWDYDTPFDEMFEYNHDGHLDRGEEVCRDIYMTKQIENDHGHGLYHDNLSYRGGSYSTISSGYKGTTIAGMVILSIVYVYAMLFELLIAVFCHPIGLIMLYFTIVLKEKLLRKVA